MQLFGIGVAGAVAPMVAQALGPATPLGPPHRAPGHLGRPRIGLVLLPVIWNVAPIYRALGQNAELTAIAERFIHVAVWLIFPAFQIIVFRSFLPPTAHPRHPAITVAGFFVNALLD